MPIESIDPATGEVIQQYTEMTQEEVYSIIEGTHEAFIKWRESDFKTRSHFMKNAARILRERKDDLAILMAREMGKPVKEGRSEAEKCAWVCDYYSDMAEEFLSPEQIKTEGSRSYICYKPIGVVLAVMPWNFPLWQVFRFAAPALMAGNAGVLKHASNVPGCALEIERILRDAGFPEDLFRTLLVGNKQVESIIGHPLIKAVTLTGSTPAGKAVAAKAGSMIKKSVLELGGSDPYVILEDADLESAVKECVISRLINTGQSCIAAKRFIVHSSLKERFESMVVKEMSSATMGDPLEESSVIGPMARVDLRDDLHRQVERSVQLGALRLLGGFVPEGLGAYYPPTVLTDVQKGMPAYDEEMFGPVACIISASDEEDAIRIANDTDFGLGAAIFTRNSEKGERIAAERFQAGCCFVNAFVRSDPRLPFGGIKESGYGRELSREGIREFVNIKTVYVR